MPRRLSWDEVAACIDRESVERYGRYLRGVVEGETYVPKATTTPSLVNRTIVLGVVYDWCRRRHRRRPLPATVRAFSWVARYCYPFHPVFARLGIGSEDVVEALEWIATDSYSFRFAPAKHAGVLVVGEHKEVERREVHHFAPVHLIAPDIDDRRKVPFDIRMATRLVMEAALRAICVTNDDDSYDSVAIRETVRDLLEVAAPLVTPD
jgi:hypothetical protein